METGLKNIHKKHAEINQHKKQERVLDMENVVEKTNGAGFAARLVANMLNENEQLKGTVKDLEKRIAELNEEINELTRENNVLEKELTEAQVGFADAEDRIEELEDRIAELEEC